MHPVSPAATHLRFSAIPNVEHVLIDALGRQHVVVRGAKGALQLTIMDAPTLIAPLALSLPVQALREIGVRARQLAKLHALMSSRTPATNTKPRWSAQSKRLRDALIVLDGRRAGATYREIAAVIYGRERIERDWPGSGLKVRVHRDFHRGLALCNGGYRDLLAEG
mgnify:FL=1